MTSELERIASRLRFLSDQAQQHRAPVIDAARKLKTAAADVRGLVVDRPDGTRDPLPMEVVSQLEAASRSADAAVETLTSTAGLLRAFAATLASGTSGAPAGRAPSRGVYQPDDVPDPTSGGDSAPPDSAVTSSGSEAGAGAEQGPPPSPRAGRSAPPRYGRYPTTTAVPFSPGNRS